MKTFAEILCAEQRCDLGAFRWRVFWPCLHRRALAITPFALCFFPRHFAADWELIRTVGRCYSLRQVDEEIRDFMLDSINRSWWRRVVKMRLSAHRLRRLARHSFIAANHASVLSGGATLR